MEISIDCYTCLVNQAVKLAKDKVASPAEQRRLLRKIMREIAGCSEGDSAPYVAHRVQRILKDYLQDPDPYRKEKDFYDTEMLKLENEFSDMIRSADHPLQMALRLAAAGNVIDFGPVDDLSREKVMAVIKQTLGQSISPRIFEALLSDLGSSSRLLYLGDNCGEIVFDKLLIRTLKEYYPGLEVQFAARGGPVLNDVTREDAYKVGMQEYARIIDTGADIQGADLARCSEEFRDAFQTADMVIAKGQGNFETLCGCGRDKLYYIFLCKCNVLMEQCGAGQNEVIITDERRLA